MDIVKLQDWYVKHQRILPFRQSRDPYAIWVSEIMLQQTQVETVLPYFQRFLMQYPTITALAAASEDELHKLVEGIGYYRRFRFMRLAAIDMVQNHHGTFPTTYDEVRRLPGIGVYTAGAIMSIAFDQPFSALDGNVIRVLSRYLGIDEDMRQETSRKKLNAINQTLVERATPHIYTQAVMELGALVCKPTHPLCETCPLAKDCFAYTHQHIEQFPLLGKRPAKKEIHYQTLLLEQDGRLWVQKKASGLLKGMFLFPQYETEDIQSVLQALQATGVEVKLVGEKTRQKHVFTHVTWLMDVYHARVVQGTMVGYLAVHSHELEQIPMAVAHRKLLKLFLMEAVDK
jgi:A/G-specific adenine glycosylase